MLRYIFSAAKNLTEEQVDKIKLEIETNHPKGSGLAMTLAEKWMEEGKSRGVAEGLEQGLEQGLVQGQQLALSQIAVLQLTNKLGALPKEVKEGLTNADLPTLQVLLTNVFTIEHVDEIRKYIQ
ncbi:hypothetical protein [Sporosarcina sp. FSL K6-3457]|uniref:hypothetical protein n=1 Tax=Sporosarcina sp. FSL K6-3457 TaxID=2978204 RepID=UPI0030F94EDA